MAGAVVGTPAYMSPEQASGAPQDARTDLYSLGVVLFEMLTGRLPLWGDTLEDTMRAQIQQPAPSPREFVDCTPDLADVCLRALAKRPEDRFESARAMRAALRAALVAEHAPVSASAESTESLAGVVAIHDADPPPARRSGIAWPWVAAALAAGAIGSTTWLSNGRPYEAAAHQLVRRAEALVPGATPLVEEPLKAPERAPLAGPLPYEKAPAVVAAPSEPPARAPSRRARERTAVDQHAAEPPTESAVVEDDVQPTPAVAEAAAVEPSSAAAEEPARTDAEKAWVTRH
jgi:serine/threonine-protein kinase